MVLCAGPLWAQTADADATAGAIVDAAVDATEPYAGVTWAKDMGPGPETVPRNISSHEETGAELVAAGAPWESFSFPTALLWGLLGGFIGAALFVKGQGRLLKTGRQGAAGKSVNVQLQESQNAVLSALQELEMMATRWKEAGMQPVHQSHPAPKKTPGPSGIPAPERKSRSARPAAVRSREGQAPPRILPGDPVIPSSFIKSRPSGTNRPSRTNRPAGGTAPRFESLGFADDPQPLPEPRRFDERPPTGQGKGMKEQIQELVLQGQGVEQIARKLRTSRESVRLFFQSDTEFSGPESRKVMNGEDVEARGKIGVGAQPVRRKFPNQGENMRLRGGR